MQINTDAPGSPQPACPDPAPRQPQLNAGHKQHGWKEKMNVSVCPQTTTGTCRWLAGQEEAERGSVTQGVISVQVKRTSYCLQNQMPQIPEYINKLSTNLEVSLTVIKWNIRQSLIVRYLVFTLKNTQKTPRERKN